MPAARILLVAVLVAACAPEPRAAGPGATASADAGPAVVPVPAVPAHAEAAAGDAGTDASARSTLGQVCVDAAFLNFESVHLSPDAASLDMCFGNDSGGGNTRECFALDLATGVYRDWRPPPRPRPKPATSRPRRRAPRPAFPPAKTKDGDLEEVLPSPDGSRLFAIRAITEHAGPDNPLSSYYVSTFQGETYDAKTGRRLAAFPIPSAVQGMNSIGMLAWLDGDHVYLRETQTYADDESAGRILDVLKGDASPLGQCEEDDDLVHVSDDVWVFLGGDGLVWKHSRDGRIEHEVSLEGASYPRVIDAGHGQILVFSKALHTWVERGDVIVLDAARGTVLRKHTLPKCGPPPAP